VLSFSGRSIFRGVELPFGGVLKEGNFENEMEFNEIKLWAIRKPAFSNSFTTHKKVQFAMGDAVEDLGMLDMGVPYELKATLQTRAIVDEE
jgi:hypothetical protein